MAYWVEEAKRAGTRTPQIPRKPWTGDGADNVVNLEHLKDLDAEQVDGGGDEGGDEDPLGLDDGAPSGDGDKTGMDAVVGGANVDDLVEGHQRGKRDSGQAARGSADGGGDHGVGGALVHKLLS